MTEYINKEQLLAHLYSKQDEPLDIMKEIAEFPAADVAPVKHGKWIHNDDWWEFICTNCRKGIGNIQKYKYCPNCGAKMDLEE